MRVYEHIAQELERIERLQDGEAPWRNPELAVEVHAELLRFIQHHLPHGSGLDGFTGLIEGKPTKLVFGADFHHMNEGGFYDGWSEHTVVVTPSLAWGINVRVTGRDRNDIKDYIGEIFQGALMREIPREDAPPTARKERP